MLGDAEAAWTPLREPRRFAARLAFADPIGRTEDVEEAVRRLAALVCRDLERAQAGARRWRLALRRVDGDTALLEARTGRPGRDAGHVLRLLALDLDGLDAGFGIELVRLEAVEVVPLGAEQAGLADRDDADGLARLVDRLAARLGPDRVVHLQPVDSHWPERAVLPVPAGTPLVPRPWLARQPRPLRLLSHPQPVEALARVPDGPPVRLGIGRFRQRVLLAAGPERILPEWWRGEGARARATITGSRSRTAGCSGSTARAPTASPSRPPGGCTGCSCERAPRGGLRRAPGHLELLLPARRLAPRGAGRAGPGAGPGRAGAHRPQQPGGRGPGARQGGRAGPALRRRLPARPRRRPLRPVLAHRPAGLRPALEPPHPGQAPGRQGAVRADARRRAGPCRGAGRGPGPARGARGRPRLHLARAWPPLGAGSPPRRQPPLPRRRRRADRAARRARPRVRGAAARHQRRALPRP